ncbi:MAG: (d)CMP kinase [Leptospiraceae bacterium]|nr:(d)CMP kinase [Leptospiraceae bacterium]MCB1316153.1 (d)CMP kinase [Leptospiraceae bacterium]
MNSNQSHQVIALDGPAGSGKSTVARLLAERLDAVHADSGAMYRTLTLALMLKCGQVRSIDSVHAVQGSPAEFAEWLSAHDMVTDVERLAELRCDAVLVDDRQVNRIDGVDTGNAIRTPEVTARIRFIADAQACREMVNRMLRDFATRTDLVVDGRDIGTVVFPDTPSKFYLDASVTERARRRLLEWRNQHPDRADELKQEHIEQDIARRDEEDRKRPVGALIQAPDAILIDTSSLDINAVTHRILAHLQIQF